VDGRLNQPREEQARRELGHTDVAAGLARLLVGAFLLSIVAVAGIEHFGALVFPTAGDGEGPERGAPLQWGALLAERPTDCSLEAFERRLEEALVVGRWALPKMQFLLTGILGAGNEQAYAGRSRWLFHRAGIEYLSGPPFLDPARLLARRTDADHCEPSPQPDPLPALRRLDEELGARGIQLIVMPTPVKAVIHPDRFSDRFTGHVSPVQNPSYRGFLRRLEAIGVLVFDPTPLLRAWEQRDGNLSAYLATDTHWRPQAMAAVAEGLAAMVEQHVQLSEPRLPRYTRGVQEVGNFGDLATMLSLPAGQTLFLPEKVTIEPVRGIDAAPWRPEPEAEILLLGDSFSNVYSNREAFTNRVEGREYHWGEGAGLAEQLSFFLQRPVDRSVRNAGGSHTTRRDLARAVARDRARGRDRLEHLRVVIYQFAVRELASGDWQEIALPPPPDVRPEAAAQPVPAGARQESVIAGTIAARTTLPRPFSVPYKDCLFAVHLTGVATRAGEPVAGEVIAYLWGMRDNAWTEAAGYRVGQRVTLHVTPWEDREVQQRYGTYNRKELDDPELLMLPAFWAEPRD
jgi:alginate O-acetyltransferase complex protein AlgJ